MDMYRWYVAKMLRENEGFWTEYDALTRQKGIVLLYKRVKGKPEIHMTYTWFRAILEKNNTKAKEAIIRGERYNLGQYLGFLLARRVERDFSKPKVDIIATVAYRKEHTDRTKTVIYFTDEDYCRIAWHKLQGVKNESVYEFKPAKDFRLAFSAAITKDPGLKFKYLFFPLKDNDS